MALKKDIEELERKIKTIERLSGQFGKNINTANLKPLEQNAEAINSIYRDLLQQQKEFNSELDVSISSFNDILSSLKKSSNSISQSKKAMGGLLSIAQKLQDNQKGYSDLSVKEIQNLKNLAKVQKNRLQDSKIGLERESAELQSQITAQKAIVAQRKISGKSYIKELNKAKKLEKQLGFIEKNHAQVSSLLNDQNAGLTVLNKELDSAEKYTQDVADNFDVGAASIQGLGAALNKLGLGSLGEKLGLDEAQKKMKSISKDIADDIKRQSDLEDELAEKRGKLSDKQIKAGFGGKGLKDLLAEKDAISEKNAGLSKMGKQFQVLKGGVKSLGKSLMTNLLSPATLILGTIKMIVDALISGDQQAGELAKGLNMSYQESLRVRDNLRGIATSAMDSAVNTKGLQESLMAVNQEMGTSGMVSEETLVTMTKLNKQAGISYDTQNALFKIGAATGKGYKDSFETFQATAKIESYRLGVAVNTKQLMADMANISNAAKLSVEGGVEGLAKQMTIVKSLGMEFGKLEGIADSLLNFESSIASELEAELLTGKDLNFEKARQLALDNDLAGMAQEISSQIGTAKDFGKMNRIAQEAFAKAAGMSRDELAGVLIEQEALAAIGGELSDKEKEAYEAAKQKYGAEKAAQMLKDGQLDQMVKQQNIQQRFNDSLEQMKEIFVTIAEPILQMVDPLVNIIQNILPPFVAMVQMILYPIKKIAEFIGFIGDGFTMVGEKIGEFLPNLGIVGKILKGIASIAIVMAAYSAFASLSAIPIVGSVLGGIAAAGILSAGFGLLAGVSKGDDVLSPGKGTGGYGDRTLFGPEGAIQLNNKDTVIAGTDLFADDMVSAPKGQIQVANSTSKPSESKPVGNGDIVAGISQLNQNLSGAFKFNQVSGIAIQ